MRPRARRTDPAGAGTYRLASSIRLPWSIGLVGLLILAVATAVLVGRTDESTLRVPQAVLDYQEQVVRDAAQSVRRSLNEGVTDLDGLGRVLAAQGSLKPADLDGALDEFWQAHRRYTSLAAVDSRGAVLARAGPAPPPDRLATATPLVSDPGMHEVPRATGEEPMIEQFVPVTAARSRVRALIAQYDPAFMRFGLEVSRPGPAWVLNQRGQILGTRVGHARLGTLPRIALRKAAARGTGASGAQSVGGSFDTQEVVGYAPMAGPGPAGRLRWAVVATRDVGSFALPQTDVRRQGLMAGVALGVLALLIFGWLYIVVVSPVLRVQREAERLAHGDLSKAVEVIRYDEVGLIARSLERLRINSIRKRVQGGSLAGSNGRTPRIQGGLFTTTNGRTRRRSKTP
jgi:hypothetical protein